MSEMTTLCDTLPDGIARVTEILGHYTAIGPADAFGAMMIHASLGRATHARRPRYRRDADRARRFGGIQRTTAAYPLQWPAGWSCTKRQQIKNGRSRRNGKWLTVFDGVERVLVELERFGTGHSGDPGDLLARRQRGASGQRRLARRGDRTKRRTRGGRERTRREIAARVSGVHMGDNMKSIASLQQRNATALAHIDQLVVVHISGR
jgi:hypothetical protein